MENSKEITNFVQKLVESQKDLDHDIAKFVDDNFFELLLPMEDGLTDIQRTLVNSLEPLLPLGYQKDFVEEEKEVLLWKKDETSLRNLIIYEDGTSCLSIINIDGSGRELLFFEEDVEPKEIVKSLM